MAITDILLLFSLAITVTTVISRMDLYRITMGSDIITVTDIIAIILMSTTIMATATVMAIVMLMDMDMDTVMDSATMEPDTMPMDRMVALSIITVPAARITSQNAANKAAGPAVAKKRKENDFDIVLSLIMMKLLSFFDLS